MADKEVIVEKEPVEKSSSSGPVVAIVAVVVLIVLAVIAFQYVGTGGSTTNVNVTPSPAAQ